MLIDDDKKGTESPRWSFIETSRTLIADKKAIQSAPEEKAKELSTADNLIESEPEINNGFKPY